MRALIQRCTSAKVTVDGECVGEIDHGLVVFLGLGQQDNLDTAKNMIDKLLKYRCFNDEQGKMGWNVQQADGGILLVSQFTLYANTQKGLRPDFAPAMSPTAAKELYLQTVEYLQNQYDKTATGIFAADMQVELTNDGPVTFMLEI
ncbi:MULTISPECIES: D-aminoacyl-tRNA deacylase [unclassified Acinetobacter]|uniref:D-aminoacyl-tRNA deacylase n=1 Tax=unclassified Acinetobacter TaxID=196816 RepID=UPI0035B7E867